MSAFDAFGGELFGRVTIMDGGNFPQSLGSLFGGQVALRFGEHFIADHEFLHGCGAQERGIEMRVQVPLGVVRAVGGPLVEAHGVGERNAE